MENNLGNCLIPMSLAKHRSGSPICNHFQHRTMVHDGGIYHTKNNNNIRRVYYYSVGPKYCIIAFIGACIYKLSVIGNVIQSVLSL